MNDVTRILSAVEQGDPHAAEQLLPLVYEELRKLAAVQIAQEKPGQTLDATALVHEAYLRLVRNATFASKTHFIRAAAEAMRRILVEHARKRCARKRGGDAHRFEVSEADRVVLPDPDTLLTIDEALAKLATEDPISAEVARLRLFAGQTIDEAADTLDISRAKAFRDWSYARAVLTAALTGEKHFRNS
jgi:RNA polymerase sigma factor (TIGR02999 family)